MMAHIQNWDDEKRKAVIDILKDKIIDWGVECRLQTHGKAKYITRHMPIEIDETMVGKTFEVEEYVIVQANERDTYYVKFENGDKDLWAYINRINDNRAEVYFRYEEVVQAAKELAEGKRPFNIISGPLKQRTCCYCKYSDGDKYITSDKKLWTDPDTEFICTCESNGKLPTKVSPQKPVCEYFETLDLEAALEEANRNPNPNPFSTY